jgi:DegV family protein with EDD domain
MPAAHGKFLTAEPDPGPGLVAVVTDSGATLPPDVARSGCLSIVPLRLLAGDLVADDGDLGSAAAIEAAVARGERLTTARPPPGRFAAAYRAAADAGADGVVSIHLSGLLSGTVSSAALAAAGAPIPVRVIDARSMGTGLGLVVLAAAAAAMAGQGLDEAAAAAASTADLVGSFFALDQPDALLAGGRLPTAPLGSKEPPAVRLVSRPVLRIRDGQVATVEQVRTRAAAADLVVRLARDVAAGLPAGRAVDVGVEHTSAPARAADLADRLAAAVPRVGRIFVVQASTAIMAHTGLGMLGVSVAPHPADR